VGGRGKGASCFRGVGRIGGGRVGVGGVWRGEGVGMGGGNRRSVGAVFFG